MLQRLFGRFQKRTREIPLETELDEVTSPERIHPKQTRQEFMRFCASMALVSFLLLPFGRCRRWCHPT